MKIGVEFLKMVGVPSIARSVKSFFEKRVLVIGCVEIGSVLVKTRNREWTSACPL